MSIEAQIQSIIDFIKEYWHELGEEEFLNINRDLIIIQGNVSEQAEQIRHYLKVIQMLQEHNTGLLMKLKAAQPQKGQDNE